MTAAATTLSPRTPIAEGDIVFCAVADETERDGCWINSFVVPAIRSDVNGVPMAYVGEGHGERAHPVADLRYYNEQPNEVSL